jgi:branched-subunit amino acid ABC-type transport system permease component
VSAIGVSFAFMGIGQLWKGVADIDFPNLIRNVNLLPKDVGLGAELDGPTVGEVGAEGERAGLRKGDRVLQIGGTAVDARTIGRVIRELDPSKDAAIAVTRDGARMDLTLRPQDLRRIRFTLKDLIVLMVTVPLMFGLTLFVKYARLGKAMQLVRLLEAAGLPRQAQIVRDWLRDTWDDDLRERHAA